MLKGHSLEPSKFLDPPFATLLLVPGRWHALSQIFLSQLHCQSCKAISLQTVDLMPSMALIYATVVVLSDSTLICLTLRSLHKDSRPNNTAFISKKLMWKDFSPRLQSPPLRRPSQTAPQPVLGASVVRVMSGVVFIMGLKDKMTLSALQCKSSLASFVKLIGAS